MSRPQEAIILMGLSGSGKGTLAGLLEQRRGFTHIESSAVIEAKFKALAGDPVIERERARKAGGDIVAAELVAKWMEEAITLQATQGISVVFSGSPRTVYEAQTQAQLLVELFGFLGIHVFHLVVDHRVAQERSLSRRVCEANQHPFPPEFTGETCPHDGSTLIKRADDSDPGKVAHRHRRFDEQTAPVLDYLRSCGFTVHEVPAGHGPEETYRRVTAILDARS